MTFKLEINCDYDAFERDRNAEIARMLRVAAEALELGKNAEHLRDYNGNRCGFYTVLP